MSLLLLLLWFCVIIVIIIWFWILGERRDWFCEKNYMWIEYNRTSVKPYLYLSLCLYLCLCLCLLDKYQINRRLPLRAITYCFWYWYWLLVCLLCWVALITQRITAPPCCWTESITITSYHWSIWNLKPLHMVLIFKFILQHVFYCTTLSNHILQIVDFEYLYWNEGIKGSKR